MISMIMLADEENPIKIIWGIFSSRTAMLIYIILILLLIISLVVAVMVNEHRRPEIIRVNEKKKKEFAPRNVKAVPIVSMAGVAQPSQAASISTSGASVSSSQVIPSPMVGGSPQPVGDGKVELKQDEPLKVMVSKEEKPEVHNESRFYMLTELDRKFEHYRAPEYNDKISLKDFCDQFRLFSSSRLGLYYDIQDIRRFVAGLAVTHILILQGMSGTGKTSLAVAFGEFLKNQTVVVPIQPMWKERTDLIGYYNEFTKKFNETTLLHKLYEANNNKEIYITVLDEMNIARVEYYFAEFLSLLELPNLESRYLDVVSDKWDNDPKLLKNGQLKLPKNMWFIGTANNDDSTFAISDKVYDRAMVLNLDTKAMPFDCPKTESCKISIDHIEKLFEDAQKEYKITNRNLRRIQKLDKYMIETFHITFGNRIMKQIRSYVPVMVACGGTELDAIDDVLARKVMRKLESQNPVYVRSQAEGLINFIEDLFGEGSLELCKEYIERIERNG